MTSVFLVACGANAEAIQPPTPSLPTESLATITLADLASTPTGPSVVPSPTATAKPTNKPATTNVQGLSPTRTALPQLQLTEALTVSYPPLGPLSLSVAHFGDPGSDREDLRGFVVETRDATSELGDACLWDCSRTVLITTYGEMVVSVLRAGDPDKAARTLTSLKHELTYGDIHEFSGEEFPRLFQLASNAWVFQRQVGIEHDSVAGASHGVIVLWVVFSYDICGEREGFVYCEGDTLYLTSVAARVAEMQLESLMAAGY